MSKLFDRHKKAFDARSEVPMSMDEFVKKVKKDPSIVASAAERVIKAIGEPVLVDTSKDERLARIHGNRILRVYPKFHDFYGMEPVIERIVSFFKHASQGLEEAKQVLYLLGPVGSAKSSLAERLKVLMSEEPIYALEGSHIQESPLGLFDVEDAEELGVAARYLKFRPSPWALKRLDEFGGDVSKFKVVKLHPSEAYQVAISKTEPGDENTQDISTLVGKVRMRALENFDPDDTDAYNYSGGLCKSNQGMLEFVEMFKAPIKMLHPLLTATQEGNYNGTEALPSIPFDGIVLAHSNESEWETFRGNKNNEAFLDRIYIVKVPYCSAIDEEVKIYEKLIKTSSLSDAPRAPGTLEMLAKFCIMSRLCAEDVNNIYTKARVYNGENMKSQDNKAKSVFEYRESADRRECFEGVSTREAYKILSQVYNYSTREVSANPVHLMNVIAHEVSIDDGLSDEAKQGSMAILQEHLIPEFERALGHDIQTSYIEEYEGCLQNIGDKYFMYADYWNRDQDYRDPETGLLLDRDQLNQELEKIEKPAGIHNVKDFRQEVVSFGHRQGGTPQWASYEKMREVLQANLFKNIDDILPVISFTQKTNKDLQKQHDGFLKRMMKRGYTKHQVQLLVDWYVMHKKSAN